MKDMIALVGLTLGKRKSRNAKVMFINTISKMLLDKNIKVQIHESKHFGSKSTNLLINEHDPAFVLVAGYDTASRMLIPAYKYYPMDIKHNYKSEIINLTLHFLLIALIVLLYPIILSYNNADLLGKILLVIIGALLVITSLYGLLMPTPAFNYKRNSVATAVAMKIAVNLSEKHKLEVALCDNTVSNYLGYKQIVSYHDLNKVKKTYIVLDSISKGEQLYLFCSEKDTGEAKAIARSINATVKPIADTTNTPLAFFPKCYYISCTEKNSLAVLDSRKNDYEIDLDLVNGIYSGLMDYLKIKDHDQIN